MHGFPVQKRSQEHSSDRTAPKPVAAEEPGGHTHTTAHTSRDKAYLVSHLRGQYLPSFNVLNGFPSVDSQWWTAERMLDSFALGALAQRQPYRGPGWLCTTESPLWVKTGDFGNRGRSVRRQSVSIAKADGSSGLSPRQKEIFSCYFLSFLSSLGPQSKATIPLSGKPHR